MNRKRVGIVGAGQLGRMLALAGYPLGVDAACSTLRPTRPARKCHPLLGRLDDARALRELASQSTL